MSELEDHPEEIIKIQHALLKKVKNALRNFKKDTADRHTKSYFDTRLSNLDKFYVEFNTNHNHLIQSSLKATSKYFIEEIADVFEEECISAISAITEAYHEKFPPQSSSDTSARAADESHITSFIPTSVRLPKIAVPSFSGKYTDWPSFYDSFLRLIHSNRSVADIEKFHYLKQSLPDDFDSDIRDLPLTTANYETAWKTLVSRYNNNRVLFTHYMNLLSSQPIIQKESASAIKHLRDTSRSCLSALRNLKVEIDKCDQIIVHFLVVKLPRETHQLWEQELGKSTEIPTFTRFTSFLDIRYRILEAMEFQQDLNGPVSHDLSKSTTPHAFKSANEGNTKFLSRREFKNNHISTSHNNQAISCFACKASHILRRCPKFLAMDCFERKGLADRAKLCINCLSSDHLASACLSAKNCQQCGKRHHTLLHFPISPANNSSPSKQPTNSPNLNQNPDSNTNSVINHINQPHVVPATTYASKFTSRSEILLPTALLKVVAANGESFLLRALLDQGSTGALISERAAQSLKLDRLPIISSIKLPNGQRTSAKFVTNITIQSRLDDQCKISVFASIVKRVTEDLPSKGIQYHEWAHIRGLDLADPDFYRSSSIDLLLGADILAKVLKEGLRKGHPNEPVAQQTCFGWIVSGEAFQPTSQLPFSRSITCSHVSLEELDALVKQFYALESISTEQQYTSEEKWCEEFFKGTYKRQANGKYLVRLPLKSLFDQNLVLGKSKQMAINRFHSTERKLQNNHPLREQYTNAIKEYFDLNQIAPAETTESQHRRFNSNKQPTYSCCVLPHHAVIKTDSPTTKCRVVFDASAITSSGRSLNDLLCNGPPLQNELPAVLLNWRLHKFVITADAKKMYRCIDINEEDSHYQRILWRNEQNQIEEY